jgi:hypothetical protein
MDRGRLNFSSAQRSVASLITHSILRLQAHDSVTNSSVVANAMFHQYVEIPSMCITCIMYASNIMHKCTPCNIYIGIHFQSKHDTL